MDAWTLWLIEDSCFPIADGPPLFIERQQARDTGALDGKSLLRLWGYRRYSIKGHTKEIARASLFIGSQIKVSTKTGQGQ
jgi:hypothetical protein